MQTDACGKQGILAKAKVYCALPVEMIIKSFRIMLIRASAC